MSGEWMLLLFATVALLLANLGQLVIPYYVGIFVDAISKADYEKVYRLTWQLMVIVFVSNSRSKPVLTTL